MVQEPVGGAHSDPVQTSLNIKATIMKHMKVSKCFNFFWLMKAEEFPSFLANDVSVIQEFLLRIFLHVSIIEPYR